MFRRGEKKKLGKKPSRSRAVKRANDDTEVEGAIKTPPRCRLQEVTFSHRRRRVERRPGWLQGGCKSRFIYFSLQRTGLIFFFSWDFLRFFCFCSRDIQQMGEKLKISLMNPPKNLLWMWRCFSAQSGSSPFGHCSWESGNVMWICPPKNLGMGCKAWDRLWNPTSTPTSSPLGCSSRVSLGQTPLLIITP